MIYIVGVVYIVMLLFLISLCKVAKQADRRAGYEDK